MLRTDIIHDIRNVLAKAGFYLSEENESRIICFDLIARRDNLLVIIKILTNVDSFSKTNANELFVLSTMLGGTPLLIGEHNSKKKIESGIIYLRYGIPMFNFQTLHDFFIEGTPPLIFSAPGGFYVNIDGDALREARQAQGISLGRLAEIAGVSRKAIQMYEKGMSSTIDIALRLEDCLKIPLIQALDPFSLRDAADEISIEPELDAEKPHGIEIDIFNQLRLLGYNVVPTILCPFDALSKDSKVLIITGISKQNRNTMEKAKVMANISKITEHYSVMFSEKSVKKENLAGTPIIQKAELDKMADSEEILTLISERIKIYH